eukprot:gene33394-38812_t
MIEQAAEPFGTGQALDHLRVRAFADRAPDGGTDFENLEHTDPTAIARAAALLAANRLANAHSRREPEPLETRITIDRRAIEDMLGPAGLAQATHEPLADDRTQGGAPEK